MDYDTRYLEVYKAHVRGDKEYVKLTQTRVSRYALDKGQQILRDMRSAGVLCRSDTKTVESKYRTRKKIYDILSLNLNEESNFVTLTYKKNEMDYKQATKDFNNMLTNFNKQNKEKLKYIVVKEHQKRGAIHYHMVTFNNPKIKWRKYWTHGRTHKKPITDVEYPEKIANYMVKYLTKNKQGYKAVEVGFRAFGYSRNLIKPKIETLSREEYESLKQTIYSMENIDNLGTYRSVKSITSQEEYKKKILPF